MSATAVQAVTTGSAAAASGAVVFHPGMALAEIEKVAILETLKAQGFNRTRAARVLGIGIRTLQRKLKEYRASGVQVEAH